MAEGDRTDTTETAFSIVAIGASAGGVEALSAFFKRMPPSPRAAFIVITHLSPPTSKA